MKTPKKLRLRPFAEAKSYIRSLNLLSNKDWRAWAKSSSRPNDIPAAPDRAYKNEWISWGDWLGTGRLAAKNLQKTFRPFKEARDFVRSQNIKGQGEWRAWIANGHKPADIPTAPESTYKEEWLSWGDWLGTRTVAFRYKKYLSFEDAKKLIHRKNIKSNIQWRDWTKSSDMPSNIPVAPEQFYKNEWISWGDWLGTNAVATNERLYRSFNEAREFARARKFKSQKEWFAWTKSPDKPHDIPAAPQFTYKEEWVSWSDWLGNYGSRWSQRALIGFLKALIPLLGKLEPSELYALLKKNNCLSALDSIGESNPLVMITKAALNGEQSRVSELSTNLQPSLNNFSSIDDYDNDEIEVFESEDLVDKEISAGDQDRQEASLPQLSAREILDALDEVTKTLGISDEETINFLIDKGISRIWQSVLSSTNPVDEVEKVRGFISDTYAQTIRNRFVDEFEAVQRLQIPQGYSFSKGGRLVQPNLMQRLIAYRLVSRKRVGNWSGTGAGKTLAAILGSQVVDSDLTLVIALNNTISDSRSGWASEIKNAFPASHVQIKDRGALTLVRDTPNYLLLNYEAFQLSDSRAMVEHLVNDHRIDLIVLDEIHSAKSRNAIESKRRQLLNYLITEAGKKNEELRVLGMSATPVVNSLDEAASLLEIITSKDYSDLETHATIANALGMHQQLILNGVRYRPDYKMELHEDTVEIRADDITERILNLRKGDVLGLENILLESKLPVILDLATPGTIVFSNFIEGIFDTVSNALKNKGLRVARFNGEDKSGLEQFKNGSADVLIGSAALGTGVDGLQYICNRLIVVTLPWTSAGYEQLLGRIYRQGSRFDRIEVFIPQVVLSHEGQEWSWDKQRFGRIKYKKTLADAAVDGFVPEGKLASQEKMFLEAKKVLESWIEALEDGEELRSIERSSLKVPLPPESLSNTLRRYGDFSQMNARIGASDSRTTHHRFEENPEEWYHYHSLYREARAKWVEVPYAKIAESLSRRPDWVVADFGCGEALLSKMIPNQVYNLDHIAIDETVTVCDMRRTPLEENSIDVAVFSLSLMGLNWREYLEEAFRILRVGGFVEISEPSSKWDGERLYTLKTTLSEIGFQIIGEPRQSHQFLYLKGVKS